MLTFIAATATVSALVAGFLPTIQIGKIYRARSSAGMSIPFIAGGFANNIIWTVYAVTLPSATLIAPNILGLIMNTTMLTVALRFRPRDASSPELAQLVVE